MGLLFSKLIWWPEEVRVLMLGIDAAGKTRLLNQMKKPGKEVKTRLTTGFNYEAIFHAGYKFRIWEAAGSDRYRPMWKRYYGGCQVLIYVVDCADRERIEESKYEFHRIMREFVHPEVPVLIFANKQDVEGCIRAYEMNSLFELETYNTRIIRVQPCCAENGTGVFEGLMWLTHYHTNVS